MALFDDVSQLARRLQEQNFGQGNLQTQSYSPPQQNTLRLNFGASQNQPAQTATDRQFHPQTQTTQQTAPMSTQMDYSTPSRAGGPHAFLRDTYQGSDIDEIRRRRAQLAQQMNDIVTTEGRNQRYWELKKQHSLLGSQMQQLRAGRLSPSTDPGGFYDLNTSAGPIPTRPGATHSDINTPLPGVQRSLEQASPKRQAQQQPTQNVPSPSPEQASPRTFTPPSPQVGYTSSKDMRNIVSNLGKLPGGA